MNPDTNKESIQIATRLAGTHIAGRAVQQINNVKLAACSLFFLLLSLPFFNHDYGDICSLVAIPDGNGHD
jgi:hypothetical protein